MTAMIPTIAENRLSTREIVLSIEVLADPPPVQLAELGRQKSEPYRLLLFELASEPIFPEAPEHIELTEAAFAIEGITSGRLIVAANISPTNIDLNLLNILIIYLSYFFLFNYIIHKKCFLLK